MLWLILHHLLQPQPATGATMTTHTTVIHDQPPTRDDLIEALHHLNDTAKAIRRKGHTGTASDAYTRQHARIDTLLDQLAHHA